MEQIQEAPMGVLLLLLIVLGLLALAIWQIAEAFLERDLDPKKKWGRRLKFVGTAVAYLAIAGTALSYALGGRSDSSESSQSFSAQLLSTPAGVVLLTLVGLLVGGVGAAFILRGVTRAFEKHLDLPAGFIIAAFTHDAETAGGLDAALHALAELPFGPIILWIVGAGLIVYGLFCFARARYAKM